MIKINSGFKFILTWLLLYEVKKDDAPKFLKNSGFNRCPYIVLLTRQTMNLTDLVVIKMTTEVINKIWQLNYFDATVSDYFWNFMVMKNIYLKKLFVFSLVKILAFFDV